MGAKENRKIYLCSVNAVRPKKSRRFDLPGGLSIALFHTRKGYFAVENRCPHAGAPLDDGMVRKTVLMCVWHGWKFDLASGACLTEPGESLRTFPVIVEDDDVYIIVPDAALPPQGST